MTDAQKVAEGLVKGELHAGSYSDGSGPVVEVKFDSTSERTAGHIWLETSSDCWIAFDQQHADAVCEAIQQAAASLRAILQEKAGG